MGFKGLLAVFLLFFCAQHLAAQKDSVFTIDLPKSQPVLNSRYAPETFLGLRFLDVEQGFPSSYIMNIAEDHLGRLWLATDGSGIVCYDGKTIRNYTTDHGLQGGFGNQICVDSKSRIWYGGGGVPLTMIDGNQLTLIRRDSLGFRTVNSILEDPSGQIWLATDAGLYVYHSDGKIENKSGVTPGSQTSFWALNLDAKGNVMFTYSFGYGWVDRTNGKLNLHPLSEKFRSFLGLDMGVVLALVSDAGKLNAPARINKTIRANDGSLLLLTDRTLVKMKDTTEIEFLITGISKGDKYMDVYQAADGRIWVSSWGGGVFAKKTADDFFLDESNGLRSNRVYRVFGSLSGKIWFCTDGGGLQVLANEAFRNYGPAAGIEQPYIMEIANVNGELWIGTRGGGLYKKTSDGFVSYGKELGLDATHIYSIHQARDGKVYLGTHRQGLYVFDGKKFKHYTDQNGLPSNTIWGIVSDDQTIWMGTHGGLVAFNGTSFKVWKKEDGLASDLIYALRMDEEGYLWIGHTAGASHFDGKQFRNFGKKEGLPDGMVWDFDFRKGMVWMATHAGIYRFNGKTFHAFTSKNGLITNVVWALRWVSDSTLVVGTEKGLQLFGIEGNEKLLPGKTFGINDGFTGNDVTPGGVYFDAHHQLWIGTGKQLVSFNPQLIAATETAPKPLITGIDLHFEKVKWDSVSSAKITSYDSLFQVPLNFSVDHTRNHLTIHFASYHLPAPELLRYKFRLGQGQYNDNTSGEVTFSNLDPGAYSFEVKASLDGEKWSEPALLQFTIHPPFYATWWFRILVVILLIAGVWAFVKNRTRTLRLRQSILEQTVRERTMEITLKNELLSEKNKEIMDSMLYARRIQNALFASDEVLRDHLGEHFVLYKPREVVSGDFYWATKISNENQEERFVLCVADCTGHGVPGAFMSLLNIAFLNESVNERKLHSPEKIFGQVRKDLAHTLRMEGNEESRDGMDAVLCSFDLTMQRMEFSCANNPLVIVRNGELLEFPADKMPVGFHFGKKNDFTLQSTELLPGDMIYLFSDGYADQFGGPVGDKAGKKFKYANLKKLFREFATLPAEVQHKKFLDTIENWKGDLEQIDDILMVGIRVPLR